jgi:hypothetical protein
MTTLALAHATNSLAVLATNTQGVSSYQVSTKRGTQSGVGVTISGAGAWAGLKGDMTFQIYSLDSSKTYSQMKSSYNIGGGVSGFFAWLGFGANADTHKSEVESTFKEITNSQEVQGKAHFDLMVSGIYPNVQVFAQAFVMVLQVTDNLGNTYNMISDGDPASDTGAQDPNTGNTLPSKNNSSSISI